MLQFSLHPITTSACIKYRKDITGCFITQNKSEHKQRGGKEISFKGVKRGVKARHGLSEFNALAGEGTLTNNRASNMGKFTASYKELEDSKAMGGFENKDENFKTETLLNC